MLFVLNAIYKVKGDGNKHDKAELLKYSLIDNVYETFVISEASEHLLERVEDVLVKRLVLYKELYFTLEKIVTLSFSTVLPAVWEGTGAV